MAYPPRPINKQFGDWFPDIPVRPVPSPPGNTTVKESALAMQPDGSDTAETLSLPKRVDFGALKVWASGAGRDSRSYDDGPDFDADDHNVQEIGDDDVIDDFCFAPGTDENQMQELNPKGKLGIHDEATFPYYCRRDPLQLQFVCL